LIANDNYDAWWKKLREDLHCREMLSNRNMMHDSTIGFACQRQ